MKIGNNKVEINQWKSLNEKPFNLIKMLEKKTIDL